MRTRLCHAMQGQGVFVCFCCAAPVVREKRGQGDGLAARGGAAVATGERTPSRGCTCGPAGPDADLAKKGTGQPGEVRAGSRQSKTTGGGDPRGRDGSSGRGGGREGGPGRTQGDRAVVRSQRWRPQASTGAGSAGTVKTTGWLDGPSWTGFPVGGGGLPRQRHCTGTDTVGGAGDEGIRRVHPSPPERFLQGCESISNRGLARVSAH